MYSFKKPPCRLILSHLEHRPDHRSSNTQWGEPSADRSDQGRKLSFSREESSRGWVWIDEASSPLLELNLKKSLLSTSDSDSVLLASNLTVERKIPTPKKGPKVPLQCLSTTKRETEELKTWLIWNVSVSRSVWQKTSPSVCPSSFCLCVRVLVCVAPLEAKQGAGGWGGAVRMPCPALSSSGWPEPSGRWASRSDRPLRESSRQEMEQDRRSQILFINLNFYPDFGPC